MDNKIKGLLVSVAGVVLWFMPLNQFVWRGVGMFQTGHHVGGIAYLMLVAAIAYGVFPGSDKLCFSW